MLLFALLCGCAAPQESQPSSNCPRLLEQSRSVGIDYVPTLRRAARGEDAALKSLFELTGTDHLTIEAAQCHIEALAELLNRLGDRQFSVALANEPEQVRRAVVSGLVIQLDNLPTADQSRGAFADQYPHTAGTVQP